MCAAEVATHSRDIDTRAEVSIAHPPERRIDALDGVRGLAIASVLLAHLFGGRMHYQSSVRQGFDIFVHGVDLFFVLSGFLIGSVLLEHRDAPHLLRTFYARRFLRIVPLYTVLIVLASGFWLKLPELNAPWWVFAAFVGNVHMAVGHVLWMPLAITWSLCVEEHFYLVAPWMTRVVPPRSLWLVLVTLFLAVFVIRFAFAFGLGVAGWTAIYNLTACRADGLAAGFFLAWTLFYQPAFPVRQWLDRHAAKLFWLLPVAALTFWLPFDSRRVQIFAAFTMPALVAASCACVWLAARDSGGRFVQFCRWTPLRTLGRHAYFLYLWHSVFDLLVMRFWKDSVPFAWSWDDVPCALLVIALTWSAAWASWRWFEGPLVRLGHRLSYS